MKRLIVLVILGLLTASLAFAQTKNMFSLQAGKNPEGIAVNPVTHKAYVVAEVDDPDRQVVMVFSGLALMSGATMPAPTLIEIPDESEYITVDKTRNRIYLSTRFGLEDSGDEGGGDTDVEAPSPALATGMNLGTLTVIDGKTDTVIATYQFPEGVEPEGVAVDTLRNIVYVGTKAPEPEPAGGTCPAGTFFIDEDGDEECWTAGKIYAFYAPNIGNPLKNGGVVKEIPAGDDPESVVFTNSMVYAANEDDGTVTIATAVKPDGTGGQLVTDTPAYSAALPPYRLGIFHNLGPNTLACPDKRYEADKMTTGMGNTVFITDDKSRVALISGPEVMNSTTIPGATQCDLKYGNDENGKNTSNNIAFMKTASGQRVYVVSEQNTVAILDPIGLQPRATITVPTARHLDAIGVDGGANLVWITDEELMQVFVLKGACANGTGACIP